MSDASLRVLDRGKSLLKLSTDALYGASDAGTLPAAVGSMRSPGIFDDLASLGLHV